MKSFNQLFHSPNHHQKWDQNATQPYLAVSANRTIYLHCHSETPELGYNKEERLNRLQQCSTFQLNILHKAFDQKSGDGFILYSKKNSIQQWLHDIHKEELLEISKDVSVPFPDYTTTHAPFKIMEIWLEKNLGNISKVSSLVFTPHNSFYFHIHAEDEEGKCVEKCFEDKDRICQEGFTGYVQVLTGKIACGKIKDTTDNAWNKFLLMTNEFNDSPQGPTEKKEKELSLVPYTPSLTTSRVKDVFLNKEAFNVTNPSWWNQSTETQRITSNSFDQLTNTDWGFQDDIDNYPAEMPIIQPTGDEDKQKWFDSWWDSMSNPQSAAPTPSPNPYIEKN